MAETCFDDYDFLKELGLEPMNNGCSDGNWIAAGTDIPCINPTTGKTIAMVKQGTIENYETLMASAEAARKIWWNTPAPQRGEIVRQVGEAFREKKEALSKLDSLVMGKIIGEGRGEVQELIDMMDFAVGQSRMLEGKVFPSERPGHFMMETWNPLGIIGVITAFNFPVAVFGWNLALAMICGNPVIWKGASSTSLISIACTKIVQEVLVRNNMPPALLSTIVGGGSTVGEHMINDARLRLVSFTGSTPIGRHVSEVVHKNFNRTILELGGNNAVIVMEDADLDLALRGAVFSAVGTAGQRCTTLRRLVIHSSVYDTLRDRLVAAYGNVVIGDPLDEGVLMGPVHTAGAIKEFTEGLETIKEQGGKVIYGGNVIERDGFYVEPTLVEIAHDAPIVKEELFVPILYLIKCENIDEAIEINNEVPQGLSSGMFTKNLQYMHQWTGPNGSDCGLVNVNIGPSGAEIGGAFGGEKETGGGRESGSDSWKQYMKRSTCTINYSKELPLAQGIKFDV